MKKSIAIFMVLMLVFAYLTGCQSNEAEKNENVEEFKVKEMTIFVRFMEMQDKWFRENTIKSFEEEYGVKINVRTFDKISDLTNILELDKDKNTIGLVHTEGGALSTLVGKDLMMDLESAKGSSIEADMDEFLEEAISLGTFDDKPYYMPKKLETHIIIYLKSKVEDATKNYESVLDEFNEIVKEYNGYGLPDDYKLEADVNEWDYFDVAVAGYYWANTEYDGSTEPRIAHRGKDYGGTYGELVERVYAFNGTEEDVLKMNTTPVVDNFTWENFYKEASIYNPGMWQEEWSGGGIWNAMANGKVYMAFMNQIDAFFIHGGSHPEMTGYLVDPDDMGLAIMPKGVSLEMDGGAPAREGEHASYIGGWWFGIPSATPDAKLSYALAQWIANEENHSAECATFGTMPTRKDIIDDLGNSFEEDWMREVFEVSQRQLEESVRPYPQIAQWAEIGQLYNDAWFDMIVNGNNENIEKTLTDVYYVKAKEILGE